MFSEPGTKMSGFQGRKRLESQKRFSGCMGRMINIFDLNADMPRAKMLTDRAHRDGSPTLMKHHDAATNAPEPVGVHAVDKQIVVEPTKSSSGKKSNTTAVKFLIAQEMSKEAEIKQKQANVIAKLMGLDALAGKQPLLTTERGIQGGYPHETTEGASPDGHEEACFVSSPTPCRTHCPVHEKEYKDVYEVWQQPSHTNCSKNQPQWRGKSNENLNEKQMALVRQKFMEAKQLATDEKLLQSKEFQDAIEVLSSNRDLFLKFLEEPNSQFSKYLNEIQTLPPPSQTKHITVLKPSKANETKCLREAKMQQYRAVESGQNRSKHYRSPSLDQLKAEILSQPTRIVVLKPNQATTTTQISSQSLPEERDLYTDLENDEATGSRAIAKEMTQEVREFMDSNRRDDSLSNGYIADESSFHRSDRDYIEEIGGNLSDSEIGTPTSRFSWDYMNRFDSPYSFSSFGHASCSSESSVNREAKKRLSERWALMASKGVIQGQALLRSSSTLGEMLAIPEVKKEEDRSKELSVPNNSSHGEEKDFKASTTCLFIGRSKDEANRESSPRDFSRSKSVPVTSSTYENIELDARYFESSTSKPTTPKEEVKLKSGKSSFQGKVSSLFFSRNRKPCKEKSIPLSLTATDVGFQSVHAGFAGKKNAISKCFIVDQSEERSVIHGERSPKCLMLSAPIGNGSKDETASAKASLSTEKSSSENPNETQEHPSPISVLEPPFEDDIISSMQQNSQCIPVANLQALSRSPPIGSLARSLPLDETCVNASSPNLPKLTKASFEADREEEEQFDFVQKILSSTSIDNEVLFLRWHSLECPLDWMLLDSFSDRKEEEIKSKQRRLSQRLLFDCVNAALLEIGRAAIFHAYPYATRPCTVTHKNVLVGVGASVSKEVWRLIRGWFSHNRNWLNEPNSNNVLVDQLVRKEVVVIDWTELIWWELDEMSKEIGGKLLEELVEEALSDFTDGFL